MGSLLLNEQPLVVLPELACKIGLNEAIVLQQLNYWINKSTNTYDGKRWVYNTYNDWQKQFPWWSISTIKRSLQRLKKLDLIITANYNQLPQDRTVWYSINYDKINELAAEGNNEDQKNLPECQDTGARPLGQNEPMGGSTPYEEKPLGQNDPMGSSNWTDASGQNEPMQEVSLSRPLPETTTETTREQQHPQQRDDDVVMFVQVRDASSSNGHMTVNDTRIVTLVDRYTEITSNDDLRPLFLRNLVESCHAVRDKKPEDVEKYVLEKLELLSANIESVKSPLRFFISAMKEDWTQAQSKAPKGGRADPNCRRCGGEGWVVSDDRAWECPCKVRMAAAVSVKKAGMG